MSKSISRCKRSRGSPSSVTWSGTSVTSYEGPPQYYCKHDFPESNASITQVRRITSIGEKLLQLKEAQEHVGFRKYWSTVAQTLIQEWVNGMPLKRPTEILQAICDDSELTADGKSEIDGLWNSFTSGEYKVELLDGVQCDQH